MFLLQVTMADSGFAEKSKVRQNKENHSPNKKVRKSLASSWVRGGPGASSASGQEVGPSGAVHNVSSLDESMTNAACETPSKSLLGTSDASMLFSPPQILKETGLPADDSGAPGMDSYSAGGGHQQQSSGGGGSNTETAASGASGSLPPKSKASRHLLFQHEMS